jgi:hypothetical protein
LKTALPYGAKERRRKTIIREKSLEIPGRKQRDLGRGFRLLTGGLVGVILPVVLRAWIWRGVG